MNAEHMSTRTGQTAFALGLQTTETGWISACGTWALDRDEEGRWTARVPSRRRSALALSDAAAADVLYNFAPFTAHQRELIEEGDTDGALTEASAFVTAWDAMGPGAEIAFASCEREAA